MSLFQVIHKKLQYFYDNYVVNKPMREITEGMNLLKDGLSHDVPETVVQIECSDNKMIEYADELDYINKKLKLIYHKLSPLSKFSRFDITSSIKEIDFLSNHVFDLRGEYLRK